MTPVTLVTGFLGTGKTTAIRSLLATAARGERWAVLVNEIGEVGIDAATLDTDGLVVREVAGGCICCSVAVPFRVAVTQVLREVKPDRLIIEPSGLADPTSLIDTLRGPHLGASVELTATIGLVHPHRMHDPRIAEHPVHRAQLAVADVLVATFAEVASAEDLQRFHDVARRLDPPKQVVATASHAVIDRAWLDLPSAPPTAHAVPARLFREPDHGHQGHGWVFPPSERFDAAAVEAVLRQLVRPGPLLPDGVARLKGIFRCGNTFRRVDATAESIRWQPVAWRRDSRVQVWIASEAPVDWDAVFALVASARQTPA